MPIDLKQLACYGAQVRIDELQNEIDEIRKAFPTGASAAKKRGRPANNVAAEKPAPVKRKRKPTSAAAKKTVGLRMKKYWAARRKAEKKGSSIFRPAIICGARRPTSAACSLHHLHTHLMYAFAPPREARQMFLLSAVLLVTTSASALGTNHLLQPASNFAWSSSTVIDQAAPPPGIDELLAKAERILALAQESKVTVRITEANRAVDGLKALRDGKTGIRNPGSVGAVNRGPGPEFGLAMSRIATQAVTSKIQPVLDIINEMGGHSLMAVLDDWAKANAAFETARNASASNTSSLEQAAENRRTGMMAVFDQLARDPAGYRASTARRDASRARGAVPAPAPTPSAQPVPAAPAAPVGAISLDQLSAQFPANAKEARNALTDIEKELAALKMLSADKNGDSISNALAGKLVILVNESAASLGQEIEAYKDTDRAIMVKHFPCVAAINGAANSLALAYKDLVILGPGLGTYGSATNLRTHLRLAIDGDPAKKTLGLVDLVSCDLDFAQTGSGASLKPQLLASVRASER